MYENRKDILIHLLSSTKHQRFHEATQKNDDESLKQLQTLFQEHKKKKVMKDLKKDRICDVNPSMEESQRINDGRLGKK